MPEVRLFQRTPGTPWSGASAPYFTQEERRAALRAALDRVPRGARIRMHDIPPDTSLRKSIYRESGYVCIKWEARHA